MPATLFRKVCIRVLVRTEPTITVEHIVDTVCLLPETEEDHIDADGKPCK
jgi:hypothetical protein